MNEKPDCIKCKFSRPIPGESHIQCRHPSFENIYKDPLAEIAVIMGKRFQAHGISDTCQVTAKLQGIRMGWFNHPFNFDPVWLITCTGYQERKPINAKES